MMKGTLVMRILSVGLCAFSLCDTGFCVGVAIFCFQRRWTIALHCIACGNMHGFVKLSVQLTDRRAPWRPAKEDIGLDSPRNNKKVAE